MEDLQIINKKGGYDIMNRLNFLGIAFLILTISSCNTNYINTTPNMNTVSIGPSDINDNSFMPNRNIATTPSVDNTYYDKLFNDLSKINNTELKLKSSVISMNDTIIYIDNYDCLVKVNKNTDKSDIIRDIYGNDYFIYQIFINDNKDVYYSKGKYNGYGKNYLYLLNIDEENEENDELIISNLYYVIYVADNFIFYIDIDGTIYVYNENEKTTTKLRDTNMKLTLFDISNTNPYVFFVDDSDFSDQSLFMYNIRDNSFSKIVDGTRGFLVTDDGGYILSWNKDKSDINLLRIKQQYINEKPIQLINFSLKEYYWIISAYVKGNDIFILSQDEDYIAIDDYDFINSIKKDHLYIENTYGATDSICFNDYWVFYYNDLVEGSYYNPLTIKPSIVILDTNSRKMHDPITLASEDNVFEYEGVVLDIVDKSIWLFNYNPAYEGVYTYITNLDLYKYIK